jgi:putative PIN family toxin of toxin-antitoxin system
MKVVIDTNVLVSAALKDREPEVVILFAASQPDIEWIVSPAIMAEYRDVLARKKFGLTEELLQKWYEILETLTFMSTLILRSSLLVIARMRSF